MDTAFPFGLPLPTAFYLTLYIVTLVIHVVFMNYVLAGAGWIAIAAVRGVDREADSSVSLLREWLPLMLSGAITAGVAPLLFLQILYKREYYTANLLLFNRWMAILPVLIVGFYALYLIKSRWLARRSRWMVAGVSLVPLAAVAFTGYSWTENHLLSLQSPEFWSRFYATRSQVYTEPQLLPRLAMWAVGSIPTLAVILAWQHAYRGTGQPRRLARLAGAGLVLVGLAAGWYALVTDEATRQAFLSPLAAPYFAAAILGVVVQAVGWSRVAASDRFSTGRLMVPTIGLTLTLVGMTVCREAVRMTALGPERFAAHLPGHAEALSKGGLPVFLGFFALNAALCGAVFWLVRHHSVDRRGG